MAKKNAAAVELGRRGGLKKVPKGFARISKKKRREIARKAAEARWGDVKAMAKEVVAAYDAGQADKRRRKKQ
jgi:hypothetical protein